MKIVLDKLVLKEFLKDIICENRTGHSADIAAIPAKDDPESNEFVPVIPDAQMSVQLSTGVPPVDDDEYIPDTSRELGLAAQAISQEVPSEKIEKFYLTLHRLLDKMQDEHRSDERESALGEEEAEEAEEEEKKSEEDEKTVEKEIAESHLRLKIKKLISEISGESPEVSSLHTQEKSFYTSAYITLIDNSDKFLPAGMVMATGAIEDTPENRSEMKIKMFDFLSNHVNFRDMNADDPGLRKARLLAVNDAINTLMPKSMSPTEEEMATYDAAAAAGIEDRVILRARQEAIRDAFSLWDRHQGDLEEIQISLDEMIDEEGGSPKAPFLQAALDAVVHVTDDYGDRLNKTKFEQVLKAVVNSDDMDPMHADDVFDVSWMETGEVEEEEEDIEAIIQNFDRHLDKQAVFFGFSGASGLRQWMTKFPERMFKVLAGGATEMIIEYKSFTNDIFSSMEDFCLNATEQLQKMSKKEKDPDKKTRMDSLLDGFNLMRSQILDPDGDEEFDVSTLESTGAGWVVRFAFGRTITQPIFTKLHKDWDSAMQDAVSKMKISDPKRKLVKTLIGETDPPDITDLEALQSFGVDANSYRQLTKISADWFTNYFMVNRKDLRKMIGTRSQDIAKIKNALKKAITTDVPDELAYRAAEKEFMSIPSLLAQQEEEEAEGVVGELSFEKRLYEMVNRAIGYNS